MKDIKKKEWEESYSRKENYIFYPKDEVVKFLNRFIRKRTGFNTFTNILDSSSKLRGLDFGCGIGRQTILLEEFGIEGYGVDISSNAIQEANLLAGHLGFELERQFVVLNDIHLPFTDGFFDFAISDSVIDSMEFTFAKQYMAELNRTVKHYVYLNVISSESISSEFATDVLVDENHERGTVQSYYSIDRIEDLIEDTDFEVLRIYKNTEEQLLSDKKIVRYHVILAK